MSVPSPLSIEDLVRGALDAGSLDDDGRARWRFVQELQTRGDRATWETMRSLCAAPTVLERVLAIDVLGQLGFAQDKPFSADTVPLLVEACRDLDVSVLAAAITALGHLHDSSGLPTVLRFVDHPDPLVRLAVASSLPKLGGDDPPDALVAALASLTTDREDEVRDWATFGLGVMLEVDSPFVRDVLVARLSDEGGDTAGEALMGLATRGDERALAPILERLQDDPGNLIVEAAGELGHWSALPLLLHLKADGWELTDKRPYVLDDAIEACLFEHR